MILLRDSRLVNARLLLTVCFVSDYISKNSIPSPTVLITSNESDLVGRRRTYLKLGCQFDADVHHINYVVSPTFVSICSGP
jgi:hypothetical protein